MYTNPMIVNNLQNFGGLDHSQMLSLLGYNLAQACQPTYAAYERYLGKPLKLTQIEYTVLVMVSSNVDVTQKKLSTALGLSAPYLTLLLDRLEKRLLLERVRNDEDRRFQMIRLTDAGKKLVIQGLAIAATYEQGLLSHLTFGERAILFELLQKVAVHRKLKDVAADKSDPDCCE